MDKTIRLFCVEAIRELLRLADSPEGSELVFPGYTKRDRALTMLSGHVRAGLRLFDDELEIERKMREAR